MDKARTPEEAAAFAIIMTEEGWSLSHYEVPERAALNLARAAIRAYLSALKEDPEVVERVARAQVSYLYPTGEGYPEYDDLPPAAVEILSACARAALSAIEVE